MSLTRSMTRQAGRRTTRRSSPVSSRFATSSKPMATAVPVRHCATEESWSTPRNVRRLMRAHELQPRHRKRFVATTDSAHDLPVFPNLAQGLVPDGPKRRWPWQLSFVAGLPTPAGAHEQGNAENAERFNCRWPEWKGACRRTRRKPAGAPFGTVSCSPVAMVRHCGIVRHVPGGLTSTVGLWRKPPRPVTTQGVAQRRSAAAPREKRSRKSGSDGALYASRTLWRQGLLNTRRSRLGAKGVSGGY